MYMTAEEFAKFLTKLEDGTFLQSAETQLIGRRPAFDVDCMRCYRSLEWHYMVWQYK